jgi:dihydrofolate reductase
MRTLTYGGAVSFDGFLAGADGSLDWLHFSKDVQQVMADYWTDIDTILLGRKTHAVSVANSPKKSKRTKRTEPTMRTYVFSRMLKEIDDPGRATRSNSSDISNKNQGRRSASWAVANWRSHFWLRDWWTKSA